MSDSMPPEGPPSGPPSGPASGPPPGPDASTASGPPAGPASEPTIAGPPSGPPPGGVAPPAGDQPDRQKALIIAGIAGVILLVVAVLAVSGGSDGDKKKASDDTEIEGEPIRLESFDEPGEDPFTASVAEDPDAPTTSTEPESTTTEDTTTTTPSTTTEFDVPPATGGGNRTYRGGQPGLYGGTRDHHSCDVEQLVAFLEDNPAKREAWAKVQGIEPDDVTDYIRGLTPVTLRTDTWVLNHGYRNGVATPIPAVLQAGTAVLVDEYGVPRAKCFCGNPLLPPRRYAKPTYTGERWPRFSEKTVVVIQQNTTIINNFTLVNKYGQGFTRPRGPDGRDRDLEGGDGTSTPPSKSTTSTTTTAPPVQERNLSAHYEVATDGGATTGTADWRAPLVVSGGGAVTATGSGTVEADGKCVQRAGGALVSTWHASISFTLQLDGTLVGGSFALRATKSGASLDSLTYSNPNAPEVADCRAQAEGGYQDFVEELLQGDLEIREAPGSTAPIGSSTLPGTVTIS